MRRFGHVSGAVPEFCSGNVRTVTILTWMTSETGYIAVCVTWRCCDCDCDSGSGCGSDCGSGMESSGDVWSRVIHGRTKPSGTVNASESGRDALVLFGAISAVSVSLDK